MAPVRPDLPAVQATAWPRNPGPDLAVGSREPVFSARDDTGTAWKSTDHVGKGILVVYFYPADMTGGGTNQACGFRDDMRPLREKGVTVVGVSGDSVVAIRRAQRRAGVAGSQ